MGHRLPFHSVRLAGPSRWSVSFLVGWTALAVCLAGCGDREWERAPVRGTVYYRGKPLAGGTIVFTPDPDRGGHGPLASGEIQKDGTFTLQTDNRPGAVPGWHRITIKDASPRPGPDHGPQTHQQRLPLRYSDPDQSGQCHEIKPDRANVLELHLE